MDLSSGGSIDGLISSLKKILLMINKDTKVVGGHSGISNQTKVKEYLNMLIDIHNDINNMIKEGKSLDEIIKSKLTSKYDTIYYDHSFIKPKDLVINIIEIIDLPYYNYQQLVYFSKKILIILSL
jgi:hypothetical protein